MPAAARARDGVRDVIIPGGVLHAGRELPVEVVRDEVPPISVEDDKTVRDRVDRIRMHQRMRAGWKPPPDHPWRRPYGSAMRTSGRS